MRVAFLTFHAAVLLAATTASAESIELLHHVPSSVVVSSAVDSKTIEPAHLVDGSRETAWNSARNELVGGWIEVTVPAGVTVDEIKLIVGHTGKGKEGDYFPMNHRIKRLRVSLDKKTIGDFDLDPNDRELQSIKIGRGGGTYRLQVLKTTPGTKKQWRELAVAELELWGTLPAGMRPVKHEIRPEFGIGVRKTRAPWISLRKAVGPTPTWDERCKLNNCKATDPGLARLAPKGSAIKNVVVEPGTGYSRVFIETATGWYHAGTLSMGAYTDATYLGKVEQLDVAGDLLQVTVDHKAPAGTDHARLYLLCGVAADKAPSCLANPIGLEVVHTEFREQSQHTVSISNGYLHVDRGKTMKAWEWILGDHALAF